MDGTAALIEPFPNVPERKYNICIMYTFFWMYCDRNEVNLCSILGYAKRNRV